MNSIRHLIAHALGLNAATVYSKREGRRLIIGIRCETCGKVQSRTEYVSIHGEPL